MSVTQDVLLDIVDVPKASAHTRNIPLRHVFVDNIGHAGQFLFYACLGAVIWTPVNFGIYVFERLAAPTVCVFIFANMFTRFHETLRLTFSDPLMGFNHQNQVIAEYIFNITIMCGFSAYFWTWPEAPQVVIWATFVVDLLLAGGDSPRQRFRAMIAQHIGDHFRSAPSKNKTKVK